MPADRWGFLRDRITAHRQGDEGVKARCLLCGGALYISARAQGNDCRPWFAHYAGGPADCPWRNGAALSPDAVRAKQYQGRQESELHKAMCELAGELASLDPRYLGHSVEAYMPPSKNKHGRFPDVLIEWEGIGKVAIEFQLSNTLQTEISARCRHYVREGVPLLWILFGLEHGRPLSQSFRDVIRQHRGNAFLLDQKAIEASRAERTLMLSCMTIEDGRLGDPELIRIDDLTFPEKHSPYYDDRIVPPLLQSIDSRRRPWFEALNGWRDRSAKLRHLDRPESLVLAAAFSIVSFAAGHPKNYASAHRDTEIVAMLNSYLNSGPVRRYSSLLEALIRKTSFAERLEGSLGRHLQRAREDAQCDEKGGMWKLLRSLLPEALDPKIRAELKHFDALPDWARTGSQSAKLGS